jgi:hypothetical protein
MVWTNGGKRNSMGVQREVSLASSAAYMGRGVTILGKD